MDLGGGWWCSRGILGSLQDLGSPPDSLVDGGDVALGHDGFEAQDDVDAEEDGDAVVAVADVRFHVLLPVLRGG